ncbi:MAG TPA: M48 family metalloprotease [Terriglobales bacterium]
MRSFRTMVFAVLALSMAAAAAENTELLSVSLDSPSVVVGSALSGTVTLNNAAASDVKVQLTANPAKAAIVPADVTVPAGAKSASFTISTVPGEGMVAGKDTVVTVYGSYGATKSDSFKVVPTVSFDQMVERVVERERKFVATMKTMHPLAETYIQNLHEDKDHNVTPVDDQYFIGRLDMSKGAQDDLFQKDTPGMMRRVVDTFSFSLAYKFLPRGFAQMVMLDEDFQKSNYQFNFVRREFLGEARCIVMDVQPTAKAPKGAFSGRVWVEDRNFNIVRFNGIYSGGTRNAYYLHFDSWRLNLQPDMWLPSYIYVEESEKNKKSAVAHNLYFKAQTRLWGYDPAELNGNDEFTQIQVDSSVDKSGAKDVGPVEAQRLWERLAEDNAIDHLQKIGLVAPAGDVEKVLETVVNNLIVTNKLVIEPEVRCRVLLTMPLESFTIGHTIVVSKGLLDVLPDEASLATILAHELGHIALNHRIDTKLAFNDRFFFPDADAFRRLDFERNPADEQAADAKALDLLANSPYKGQLASAGLFLKALQERSVVLTSLISPHMGNRMANKNAVRMASLSNSAPAFDDKKLDQVAALPLGSRVNLDPWSNHLAMLNAKPVALLSPSEKMPFEVTPFFPYISYNQPGGKVVAENTPAH